MFAPAAVELRHGDTRIVWQKFLAHVLVGISVEQRADKPAVEIAGAKQGVADRKCEIEVARLHESEHVVNGVHPADRIDWGNIAKVGMSRVVGMGQRAGLRTS